MEYISGFLIILGNLRTDLSISYYLQEMVILIRLHLKKLFKKELYWSEKFFSKSDYIEEILNLNQVSEANVILSFQFVCLKKV